MAAIEEVDDLDETVRGAGGFGSTGVTTEGEGKGDEGSSKKSKTGE